VTIYTNNNNNNTNNNNVLVDSINKKQQITTIKLNTKLIKIDQKLN